MHDGLWEVGLLRVLAWTENRCRGFWRIPVSKFQAVDYHTFRDAGATQLSIVGGRTAISPVPIPGAEGSTGTVHTHTPISFAGSAYLLRERCTVRICLVLIKSQHSVLRTTILYWSTHSSKRSLGEVLPSLFLWTTLSKASDQCKRQANEHTGFAVTEYVQSQHISMEQRRKGKNCPAFSSG